MTILSQKVGSLLSARSRPPMGSSTETARDTAKRMPWMMTTIRKAVVIFDQRSGGEPGGDEVPVSEGEADGGESEGERAEGEAEGGEQLGRAGEGGGH